MATSAGKASKETLGMGIWSGTHEPGTFPAPRNWNLEGQPRAGDIPCSKEPSTCRQVKTWDESSGVHGSSSPTPQLHNEPEQLNQALGNLSPGCHTTKCPLCLPNSLGVTRTWSWEQKIRRSSFAQKTELGSVPAVVSNHSLRSLFKFTEELCSKCH